jgi:hypothetical protein
MRIESPDQGNRSRQPGRHAPFESAGLAPDIDEDLVDQVVLGASGVGDQAGDESGKCEYYAGRTGSAFAGFDLDPVDCAL